MPNIRAEQSDESIATRTRLARFSRDLLAGHVVAFFKGGLVGFLSRRNMIVMFLCAEMMLQGVSVSLVAWGRWHNNWDGQILVPFCAESALGGSNR